MPDRKAVPVAKSGLHMIALCFLCMPWVFSCEPSPENSSRPELPKVDASLPDSTSIDALPPQASNPERSNQRAEDWPGFLGLHRDGKSPETGLNWAWKDAQPKTVWSRPLRGGYGIGSVANGKYFQLDGNGTQASLICLKAETGEELWNFEYRMEYEDMYGFDNGPRCSPVIDEDRVYILGVEGMLHCLKAETGEKIWEVDTTSKFHVMQNFFGVGSSPVVHGDLLIVMVGGSPADAPPLRPGQLDEAKPAGSAIVAFDKRTGEIRYTSIDDLASYASPVIATINDRLTGLAFCRNELHAFDPGTGKPLWSFPWRARKYESVNASTPVVSGDRVLITESYGPGGVLLDVSGEKPAMVWQDENIRNQRLSCHWCTPIVVDGFAYACHGENVNGAELRCIELATGEIKWSQAGLGRCSLTYADGQLVCMADSGSLFVVRANPEQFELTTQYLPVNRDSAFAPPCYAAPILSHGLLYVRDARRVTCLDLRTR